VKKLRRLAIADDAAANALLETTYWPHHNVWFRQAPASSADFHRRCPSPTALNRIFRLEETRTIGLDWVVRYHNRVLQLARQSGYAPARSTVTVCEWPDGRLAIEYRGRAMPWTEVTGRVTDVVPTPAAVTALRPTPWARAPRADHPWRTRVVDMRTGSQLWQAIRD